MTTGLYNRQLHVDKNPHRDERTLAKQIAEKSGGKYTQAQVEDQLRNMGMTIDGKHHSGAPETLVGEMPTDTGATWIHAGMTSDGKPILTQVTAQANPELQSYILANYNSVRKDQVPSVFRYDLKPNDDWSFSVTGPFTRLPNQAEIKDMRNTAADAAGFVSTQAGRVSATAGSAAAIPGLHSSGAVALSFGAAVVSFGRAVFSK